VKKKQVLFLIIISLLLFNLNISAQDSMLFDKNQFQEKFNQNTPGLDRQKQGEFQQQMQNKKQESMQKTMSAPDMSMGQGFIGGLEGPSMEQIDKSQFEGFHFDKEQVTPDKFKQDFSSKFAEQQQQNMKYGQSGIEQAQGFDNSIPKEEMANTFKDKKNGFSNQFGEYKDTNKMDLTKGQDEFVNNFDKFREGNNSEQTEFAENFNANHNTALQEVEGENIFETGEAYDSESINTALNTQNPFNGKESFSSRLNPGGKPDNWGPGLWDTGKEMITGAATQLGSMIPSIKDRTEETDPQGKMDSITGFKEDQRQKIMDKAPGFGETIDGFLNIFR